MDRATVGSEAQSAVKPSTGIGAAVDSVTVDSVTVDRAAGEIVSVDSVALDVQPLLAVQREHQCVHVTILGHCSSQTCNRQNHQIYNRR